MMGKEEKRTGSGKLTCKSSQAVVVVVAPNQLDTDRVQQSSNSSEEVAVRLVFKIVPDEIRQAQFHDSMAETIALGHRQNDVERATVEEVDPVASRREAFAQPLWHETECRVHSAFQVESLERCRRLELAKELVGLDWWAQCPANETKLRELGKL